MPQFFDWLTNVVTLGESVLESNPSLSREERPGVERFLRRNFAERLLDVAGPSIEFDPATAVAAAELLANACWQLVAGEGESMRLELGSPTTPSTHMSADLVLRFLPAVFRRSRLREEGKLTRELERILRTWPLSGVLADLDGKLEIEPEFGGHAGLLMLYAERLLETGQTGWVPTCEPARSWVERVFRERGKPIPFPPTERKDGA